MDLANGGKCWITTWTGDVWHAFTTDHRAVCNGGIRPMDHATTGRPPYVAKPSNVGPWGSVCKRCAELVAEVETEAPVKLSIEPRGTVYGNPTYRQWTRVINGWMYHFTLMGPSDYWKRAASVTVRRHPYGRLSESTVIHRDAELTQYVAGSEDKTPCRGDRGHFMSVRCVECNARALSRANPDRVDTWYRSGVVSQAEFEAFMHAWATSAARYSSGGWATEPTDPDVVAIVTAIRRHARVSSEPIALAS